MPTKHCSPPSRSLVRVFPIALIALVSSCGDTKAKTIPNCDALVPLDATDDLAKARNAFAEFELRRSIRWREVLEPGYLLRVTRKLASQSNIESHTLCYQQVRTIGKLLFEHEYGFVDGLGNTDAKTRPDPFRRVHTGSLGGPETNSCASCHWRGGPTGGGSLLDNSFVNGDGVHPRSGEARNPPALLGSGVVQALAQEMSAQLHRLRDEGIAAARETNESVWVPLQSKGISFGKIRITPTGEIDTSKVQGVDPDLQIKPFGWRGEFATIRDFAMVSTHVHLGLQSDDLLYQHANASNPSNLGKGRKDDVDADGMVHELSPGQLTAIVVYLASLQLPVVTPPDEHKSIKADPLSPPEPNLHLGERFLRGKELFSDIGCTLCHVSMLVLDDPIFTTHSQKTGTHYSFDLSTQAFSPRLHFDATVGGYPVWLFSDMKRHDLGVRAQSPTHTSHSGHLRTSEFLTRRLWGLAATPPYFYDGRSPTIEGAIDSHGGEADFARQEFENLRPSQQNDVKLYLLGLRRPQILVVP